MQSQLQTTAGRPAAGPAGSVPPSPPNPVDDAAKTDEIKAKLRAWHSRVKAKDLPDNNGGTGHPYVCLGQLPGVNEVGPPTTPIDTRPPLHAGLPARAVSVAPPRGTGSGVTPVIPTSRPTASPEATEVPTQQRRVDFSGPLSLSEILKRKKGDAHRTASPSPHESIPVRLAQSAPQRAPTPVIVRPAQRPPLARQEASPASPTPLPLSGAQAAPEKLRPAGDSSTGPPETPPVGAPVQVLSQLRATGEAPSQATTVSLVNVEERVTSLVSTPAAPLPSLRRPPAASPDANLTAVAEDSAGPLGAPGSIVAAVVRPGPEFELECKQVEDVAVTVDVAVVHIAEAEVIPQSPKGSTNREAAVMVSPAVPPAGPSRVPVDATAHEEGSSVVVVDLEGLAQLSSQMELPSQQGVILGEPVVVAHSLPAKRQRSQPVDAEQRPGKLQRSEGTAASTEAQPPPPLLTPTMPRPEGPVSEQETPTLESIWLDHPTLSRYIKLRNRAPVDPKVKKWLVSLVASLLSPPSASSEPGATPSGLSTALPSGEHGPAEATTSSQLSLNSETLEARCRATAELLKTVRAQISEPPQRTSSQINRPNQNLVAITSAAPTI